MSMPSTSSCVLPACYKDFFFVISNNLYLDNGPMYTNTAFLFPAIMKETIIGSHYIWELRVFCTGGGPSGDKLKGSIKYLEPCYNLFSLPILYISPLKFDCTHNTYINWIVMVMKMKVQNCIFCTAKYMHEKRLVAKLLSKIIEIMILSHDFKLENVT